MRNGKEPKRHKRKVLALGGASVVIAGLCVSLLVGQCAGDHECFNAGVAGITAIMAIL